MKCARFGNSKREKRNRVEEKKFYVTTKFINQKPKKPKKKKKIRNSND